jgi:hypothetical protein
MCDKIASKNVHSFGLHSFQLQIIYNLKKFKQTMYLIFKISKMSYTFEYKALGAVGYAC